MKLSVFLLACIDTVALGLFVSSRGLLAWAGPIQETPIGANIFDCHYFTGAGVITRTYFNEATGLVSRDTCPRFLKL